MSDIDLESTIGNGFKQVRRALQKGETVPAIPTLADQIAAAQGAIAPAKPASKSSTAAPSRKAA